MRRSSLIRSLLLLAAPVVALGPSQHSLAQEAASAPDAAGETSTPGAVAPEPPVGDEAVGDPMPPSAEPAPLQVPSDSKAAGPRGSAASLVSPAAPAALPTEPAKREEKSRWKLPETVFHVHGYLRMRGTLLKDGALGHHPEFDRVDVLDPDTGLHRTNVDPFATFVPEDSVSIDGTTAPVENGCGSARGANGGCGKKSQVSGDLRLRLKPEVHLSDDIRVKAWIDVLDNVGLGTSGYGPSDPGNLDLRNSLRVRRAWGEARNRDVGELRFGRMGADWGLGILDNGGDRNGIDSDFSTDVDRIMALSNLGGFYLMGAFDWASQGKMLPGTATPSGVPVDRAQRDDRSALTFAAAHRLEESYQQSVLSRGSSVFNYGAYFVFRRQFLEANPSSSASAPPFLRYNQKQFIPDLWFQFLWEGLRVELEAAFVAGSLEGGCPKLLNTGTTIQSAGEAAAVSDATGRGRSANGSCKFRQLGVALESEYRLFDDKLGVHFHSGFASGDGQGYGLAQSNDPSYQRVGSLTAAADDRLTTYQFHPDYRVDLILWRTLMRRVAGAYYFKPGISYDFIHDAFGQRAGGRVDVIYSRASTPKQTWGQSGNLGLEMDVSLYYRSEDGPDPMDGFYGMLQWGILFPFQGLDYDAAAVPNAPASKNAMILRGVAGIAF
jgi:uncharacterized protein (TIGR04551 family)